MINTISRRITKCKNKTVGNGYIYLHKNPIVYGRHRSLFDIFIRLHNSFPDMEHILLKLGWQIQLDDSYKAFHLILYHGKNEENT